MIDVLQRCCQSITRGVAFLGHLRLLLDLCQGKCKTKDLLRCVLSKDYLLIYQSWLGQLQILHNTNTSLQKWTFQDSLLHLTGFSLALKALSHSKNNSQPCFLTECAMAKSHCNVYHTYQSEQASRNLPSFRIVFNHCKSVLENAKISCVHAVQAKAKNKKHEFHKFWKIENAVLTRRKE